MYVCTYVCVDKCMALGTQYNDRAPSLHSHIQYADSTYLCAFSVQLLCIYVHDCNCFLYISKGHRAPRAVCHNPALPCTPVLTLSMQPAVVLLHLLMPVVTPPTHTHALSMQRLLLQFVLPALTAEFVDRRMIPFVLPNILLVAEGLTSDEYLTHVLPSLLPVFQMEEPVQVSTLW